MHRKACSPTGQRVREEFPTLPGGSCPKFPLGSGSISRQRAGRRQLKQQGCRHRPKRGLRATDPAGMGAGATTGTRRAAEEPGKMRRVIYGDR